MKSVESADSSIRSRCVAIRFAATLSLHHYIRRRNGPSFSMSAFFLCTEREVWLDENRFKFGLPDPPAAHRCKKSCKVNFMPHRSPLARTSDERTNEGERHCPFQSSRACEQRGISRALKAAVDRGRRGLSSVLADLHTYATLKLR